MASVFVFFPKKNLETRWISQNFGEYEEVSISIATINSSSKVKIIYTWINDQKKCERTVIWRDFFLLSTIFIFLPASSGYFENKVVLLWFITMAKQNERNRFIFSYQTLFLRANLRKQISNVTSSADFTY
jgi:hypothetical protein